MKLGLPNSLLGAAASVVKFVLLLSFAFNMMTQLEIMNVERTESSHLYQPVCDVCRLWASKPAHSSIVST